MTEDTFKVKYLHYSPLAQSVERVAVPRAKPEVRLRASQHEGEVIFGKARYTEIRGSS